MHSQTNISPGLCIGIDPGLTGAIAAVTSEPGRGFVCISLWDMPTVDGHLDAVLLNKHIAEFDSLIRPVGCIEVQPAGATYGSKKSTATYWEGIGLIEGIFVARNIKFIRIVPLAWRTGLGVVQGRTRSESKSWSIRRAKTLFSNVDLGRRKDAGRAEALLIAAYGLKLAEK